MGVAEFIALAVVIAGIAMAVYVVVKDPLPPWMKSKQNDAKQEEVPYKIETPVVLEDTVVADDAEKPKKASKKKASGTRKSKKKAV